MDGYKFFFFLESCVWLTYSTDIFRAGAALQPSTSAEHLKSWKKVLLPFEPQTYLCDFHNQQSIIMTNNKKKGSNTRSKTNLSSPTTQTDDTNPLYFKVWYLWFFDSRLCLRTVKHLKAWFKKNLLTCKKMRLLNISRKRTLCWRQRLMSCES